MSFLERCAAEVADLHAAFEAWFAGEVDDDAEDRIRDVLAPGFTLVTPTGAVLDRDRVLADLAEGRGRDRVVIRVENIRVTPLDGRLALALYEEWHDRGETSTGRISSAVLLDAPGAGPHGVKWLHVHETWVRRRPG